MAKNGELEDRVVYINRVSKAISGGSTFTFSTMVAVGNGDGRVGIGIGQADEVAPSIHKGKAAAKKNMIDVPQLGTTIPHEIERKYDSAHVLLKPAHPGTGVIAGGAVRAVVELAGINDILTKSLGSDNPLNIARATFEAFKEMRDPHKIANLRGIPVDRLLVDNPFGGLDKLEEEAEEESETSEEQDAAEPSEDQDAAEPSEDATSEDDEAVADEEEQEEVKSVETT